MFVAMRSVMQLSCSALLLLAGGAQPAAARSTEQYAALAATLKETGAQLEVRRGLTCRTDGRVLLLRLIGCTCTGSVCTARRGLV